jgi:hypothetical protein
VIGKRIYDLLRGLEVLGETSIDVHPYRLDIGAQVAPIRPATVLADPTNDVWIDRDLISDRDGVDGLANLRYLARVLVSGDQGHLDGPFAVEEMDIGSANAAGLDIQENLVVVDLGNGNVLVPDIANRVQYGCLHLTTVRFPAGWMIKVIEAVTPAKITSMRVRGEEVI